MKPQATATIHQGDCRLTMRRLAAEGVRVNTIITSPPYFNLRDYRHEHQIGQEETPEEYAAALVDVFRAARPLLADDGTVWLNLGDTYAQNGGRGAQGATSQRTGRKNVSSQEKRRSTKPPPGLKAKDLIGIPWLVAFALRADGWFLRRDIIWHKPNACSESVRDRPTTAHEYVFLLSKSARYRYDSEAIQERAVQPAGRARKRGGEKYGAGVKHSERTAFVSNGSRNKRSVWSVNTVPFPGAHFATFPPDLVEPCVLAGAPKGGIVLDPFSGSGATGVAALRKGRHYIGCEVNPDYIAMSVERIGSHHTQVTALEADSPLHFAGGDPDQFDLFAGQP